MRCLFRPGCAMGCSRPCCFRFGWGFDGVLSAVLHASEPSLSEYSLDFSAMSKSERSRQSYGTPKTFVLFGAQWLASSKYTMKLQRDPTRR